MNKVLIAILLFLLTSATKAYYIPLPLYSMVLKAEKIVSGEIISLDSMTFTIKIENSLTGEKGMLTIEKFNDWTCAQRWTEYRIGQKMFLFLITHEGRLVTMSGGNEGELPMIRDSIFISGRSLPPSPPEDLSKEESDKWPYKEYFETKSYEISGAPFYGCRFSLVDFIKTVNAIRECFNVKSGSYGEIKSAEIICEKDKVDERKSTDKLFRWTYGHLIK
jgi:hypothetical protein